MIWKVTRQDRPIGQTHYILSYGHISVLHLHVFISGESSRRHDAIHARRQVGILSMLAIKIGLIGLYRALWVVVSSCFINDVIYQ